MVRCLSCMRQIEGPYCPHCGYPAQPQNQEHQLKVGTVLQGRYQLGRVLGQGGFGITYLAWDTAANTRVAVKEFFPTGTVYRDSTASTQVRCVTRDAVPHFEYSKERFLREARALVRFKDIPQIVDFLDFVEDNNTAYIVMEFVAGVDLAKYIQRRGGCLNVEETFRILRPVMEALAEVHKAGIIHRDISPDNVILDPTGGAKLLDFGAVRTVQNPNAEKVLTKSTEAILKQGFAPLEQYNRRGSLGPWTDEYAMCATIWYCLTGKIPDEPTMRMTEGIDPDWSTIPGLTRQQQKALAKGISCRPKDRYPDMDRLLDALFPKTARKKEPEEKAEITQKTILPPKMTRDHGGEEQKTETAPECTAVFTQPPSGTNATQAAPIGPSPEPQVKSNTPTPAKQAAPAKKRSFAINRKGLMIASLLLILAGVITISVLVLKAALPGKQEPEIHISATDTPIISVPAAPSLPPETLPATQPVTEPVTQPVTEPPFEVPQQYWFPRSTISATNHSLALLENGTVTALGNNEHGENDLWAWQGIVSVSADHQHSVGLKADGTVVAQGDNSKGNGQCNVSDWQDIQFICADSYATFGITSELTVVTTERYPENYQNWTDIIAISANGHVVGLKKDGTVVALGNNDEGQIDVEGWTEIVAVTTGWDHTLGLRADGTVVATGYNAYGQCNVSDWTDIVAIGAGREYSIGLKADGTVVIAGRIDSSDWDEEYNAIASQWTDIVAIAAGNYHVVALRADGTVVAAGHNGYGQCNVSSWRNVAMPD